jgi:hypothetical protein
MAATTTQTVDVAQTLAAVLCTVDGVRVYPYPADTVRPPAVVIGQPDVDFADTTSGFCAATWSFPLTVITTRANDRDAQTDMSRLLMSIVTTLAEPVPGVFSVEPQDARPTTVGVNGQELPGYLLTVKIRA